jgi:hypothetical protein
MGTTTCGNRPETGRLTASPGGMNLAVLFFVELGEYASFAYWGAATGSGALSRVTLGVLAPLVAVTI